VAHHHHEEPRLAFGEAAGSLAIAFSIVAISVGPAGIVIAIRSVPV
jgi:hypothetical protein